LGSPPGFGKRECGKRNRMFDDPIIIVGPFLFC
jgi:hypothetical protein